MKPTHIYWFTYFNISEATVRYRGLYFLQFIKQYKDVTYSFVHPSYKLKDIMNFIAVFLEVLFFRRSNSLIVFQKIYTHGLYASLLKILLLIRVKYTVYDIDDAEYVRRNSSTIDFFILNSEMCVTGSMALIHYAHLFKSQAKLITSPVINHTEKKIQKSSIFTIGWVGYYSAHRESLLQILFPAILDASERTKLVMMGVRTIEELIEIENYFESNSLIEIVVDLNINWLDECAIYKRISKFDVGVSPLLDNEFNRAKSAFKLKQYLSCGVPVIASNVGENARFIKEGANGFLADNSNEFAEKIFDIRKMSDYTYSIMSANSLNTIPELSIQSYSELYLNIFKIRN